MAVVKANFLLQDSLAGDEPTWSKCKLGVSRLLSGLEQQCMAGSLHLASVKWRWDILADTSKLSKQHAEKFTCRNCWLIHKKDSFISFCQQFRGLSHAVGSREGQSWAAPSKTFYKSLISSALKASKDSDSQVSKIITPARLNRIRDYASILPKINFNIILCDSKLYNELIESLPSNNQDEAYSFLWIIIDSVDSITNKRPCDHVYTIDKLLCCSAQLFISIISRKISENLNYSESITCLKEFETDILSLLSESKIIRQTCKNTVHNDDMRDEIFSKLESLINPEEQENIDRIKAEELIQITETQTTKVETFMELGSLFQYFLYHEEPLSEFIEYFSKFKESLRKTLKSKYAVKIIDSGLKDVIQPVEYLKTHWLSHVFDFLSEKSSPAPALMDEEQEYLKRSAALWKQGYKKDDFIPNYCRTMMCRSIELMIIVIFELFRSSQAKDKNVKTALEDFTYHNVGAFKNLEKFLLGSAESLVDYLCIQFACIADIDSSIPPTYSCSSSNNTSSRKLESLYLDEPCFFKDIIANPRYSKTIPKITKALEQKFATNFFSPVKTKPKIKPFARARRPSIATHRSSSLNTTLEETSSQLLDFSSETYASSRTELKLKTNFVTVQLPDFKPSQASSSQNLSQISESVQVVSKNFYGKTKTAKVSKPSNSRKRLKDMDLDSQNSQNNLHFTPVKMMKLDNSTSVVISETPLSSLSAKTFQQRLMQQTCLISETPTRPSPRLQLGMQSLKLQSDIFVPDTPLNK